MKESKTARELAQRQAEQLVQNIPNPQANSAHGVINNMMQDARERE
jgi:hypothetical protein